MAVTGIQIFKLTPKKNCKACGCPTCMAFSMKAAQGALPLTRCPHLSQEAIDTLTAAAAPPMRTVRIGEGECECALGGETVLFRHEKTFVSPTRYGAELRSGWDGETIEKKLAGILSVDYERIGERMRPELLYLTYDEGAGTAAYCDLVRRTAVSGRTLILGCADPAAAREALAVCGQTRPVLDGANASNYEEMNRIAKEYGAVLAVSGRNLDELYDTAAALGRITDAGFLLNTTMATAKETFAATVQVRRAALAEKERVFGWPSLVNLAKLARGDRDLQRAYAALFTMKYGSAVILEELGYAEALPLFGLRQNLFTDPQKPMKVEPGLYPLNGADAGSVCVTTVDFALTYFLVSGELERSGVPVNLVINDAGGLSVLTAWAAGKFSGSTIARFFLEHVQDRVTTRKVIIPGKVAVLKGDIEERLPGWEVIVAPPEAVQLAPFLKELREKGTI